MDLQFPVLFSGHPLQEQTHSKVRLQLSTLDMFCTVTSHSSEPCVLLSLHQTYINAFLDFQLPVLLFRHPVQVQTRSKVNLPYHLSYVSCTTFPCCQVCMRHSMHLIYMQSKHMHFVTHAVQLHAHDLMLHSPPCCNWFISNAMHLTYVK